MPQVIDYFTADTFMVKMGKRKLVFEVIGKDDILVIGFQKGNRKQTTEGEMARIELISDDDTKRDIELRIGGRVSYYE